ncbi:hypothetical protein B0H17DRAFT_1063210 [Mycena rosella]|uniref:DUF6534 domain-containing protein n=1 Tax=Mycena rosella TaxID=1033263 RepID=A0AAD7GJY7_MYCRO|nr:hypothetical protein B0H17DRAFT_1063210 [Mycena rosella]
MSGIPPLDSTLGAVEIGGVVSTFLFGLGTLQTYHFYQLFPADRRALKWTVAILWFLELAHTIATWHAIYTLTVTLYAQPQFIDAPPHSIYVTILLSALISGIVQTLFANRIRVLSGRWPITLICWVLTLARGAFAITAFVVILQAPSLLVFEAQFPWLIPAAFGIAAGVDVLVAGSLCYYLWKMRANGADRTRRMVETMVTWTIETGLVTCASSVVGLIMVVTRHDLLWATFFLISAKLFSNCYLASLNARQRLRESDRNVVNFSSKSISRSHRPMVVEMTTVTHSAEDFRLDEKDLEAPDE